MKFNELYDRTSIEIEKIITAIKLNGIQEYCRLERPPFMRSGDVKELMVYVTKVLENSTVWNNLISCMHVSTQGSAHSWNTEKSKQELNDILDELKYILLKSERYEPKNKPDGSTGIWDRVDFKFVDRTEPQIDRYHVRLYTMGLYGIWDRVDNAFYEDSKKGLLTAFHKKELKNTCDELNNSYDLRTWDFELQPAFENMHLSKPLDIGTTFKTDKVEAVKISLYINDVLTPVHGFTNPNHTYKIVGIQEHIVHCEVIGQTDESYYVFGKPLVVKYL